MILVSALREAISEICSNIPEIRNIKTVSTDDRFVKRLEEHRLIDNTMLVIVVPEYKGFKKVEEVGGYDSYLQFFFLDKIDYKTTEPEDVQQRLQPLVQDFLQYFGEHQTGGCYTFGNVDQNDVYIRPVTNKAGCCGWEVQIMDESYTGFDGRIG